MNQIAHLLNRACEITPVSVGSWTDDGGFATEEGSVVNTKCRLFPLSAREREELAHREVQATHVVYLQPGIEVKRGYMIELPDGQNPEHTLYVEYVQVPSEMDLYQRVVVSSTAESGAYGGETGLRDVLISDVTVNDEATLDVGDINASPLHTSYNGLKLVLHGLYPMVDGDYLQLRYGGNGSWWDGGNYHYTLKTEGSIDGAWSGLNQTLMLMWGNSSVWNQGNNYGNENLYGLIQIALNPGAVLTDYSCKCDLRWGNTNSIQYGGRIWGRYPTTGNLTAARFWYAGGNISGTAQLWGTRKP